MRAYQSIIADRLEQFVHYRKASSNWCETYAVNLHLFDKYCSDGFPQACVLTQEMVDGWCKKRETESNNSCRARIDVVIAFLAYANERDWLNLSVSVIPKCMPITYIPHAFTNEELGNFFKACDSIKMRGNHFYDRLNRITFPVFFRLLFSSGLRTNEARQLERKDVDLDNGVINISQSKGYNQHRVALHDSMRTLMIQFDKAVSLLIPDRKYFFPDPKDRIRSRYWVQDHFKALWRVYNNSYATAYALRHHYATQNINSWKHEGFDFHARLLYLSRSMGHSILESTKYYYSLVPGLADIMEELTNKSFNDLLPEMPDYEKV
jgi:integrase